MAETPAPGYKPRPPPPVGKKPQFPHLRTPSFTQQNAAGLDQTLEQSSSSLKNGDGVSETVLGQSTAREIEGISTPGLESAVAQDTREQEADASNDLGTAVTNPADIFSPNDTNTPAVDAPNVPLPHSPQQPNGNYAVDELRHDDQPDETEAQMNPLNVLHHQISILLARIQQLEAHPTTMLNKLEARVDALEKKDDDAGSESGEREGDKTGLKFCKPETCLNIITINDWDKRKFTREEPHALIDVVVASDYFDERKEFADHGHSPLVDQHLPSHFHQPRDHIERVKFIQVNSVPFRHLYHYVIGTESTYEAMIVLAPFKTCTIFEKEYQQMLESLESKWKDRALDDPRAQVSIKRYNRASAGEHDESPPRHEPDDLTHDSYEAYLALKCWHEFYRRFVKARWDWLRSDKVDLVRFGDLCDLFQPGDDVYQPGNAQRVWRVCKVTGGRPVLQRLLYGSLDTEGAQERPANVKVARHQAEAQHPIDEEAADGSEDSDWTLLQVEGYYLDYDGTDYGPSHKIVTIKYFPGKKSARSLKLWPLRLVQDDYKLYDELTRPGIKFFEKCQPGLHYYDGRTLTETPGEQPLGGDLGKARSQDVNSAVFVDFVKAFQYNPDWSPDVGLKEFEQPDPREITVSATDGLPIDSKFRIADTEFEFAVQNIEFPDYWALRRYRQTDEWIRESGGSWGSDRNSVKKADQILFPNRLFGFVFQTRDWACFDVDERHLKGVKRDDSAWNELALPDNYKQTLESLVELYFANKQAMATHGKAGFEFDFIHGKGKYSFSNTASVANTSTAESIAAKYQKPLLPITCGNLGINAQSVEQNLNENFQLAQAWDAIVLLDEADIFLARRGRTTLERNALVSVFLRTLEYYTGVLFLTTNRVGAFDGAFISRVHCSLYYPPLKLEQSEQIWTNNLRRLLRQRRVDGSILNVDGIGEEIMAFARAHFYDRKKLGDHRVWNGRQIRNSFQTAVALAEYEVKVKREKEGDVSLRVTLKASHFDTVARASAEFEKYLDTTLDKTEAELLDEAGERAANYSTPTPFDGVPSEVLGQGGSQSRVAWADPAAVPQNNPGTPTPGADLYRRPTFNSRIPHGQSATAAAPSQAASYPHGTPVGLSALPPGYAVVMTPQGQQVVQLQGAQPGQPFMAHASPGQTIYHQFVQQAGAGAPSDQVYHTPSKSTVGGVPLHSLNQPLTSHGPGMGQG
ncbi:hypothetical protein PRZ48_008290 [Zasmidium cellare]|uniref:ATPase AAA-type core domain-containing protein n=1 Tax=Zasmidium cellare TaxID=395010 RepID=A0ABR0EF17_ZASCE|nr:hypothetical protein PRZ48_008290 [Zasmidium cellare]